MSDLSEIHTVGIDLSSAQQHFLSNKQFEEFAKKWNYDLSTDEEGFYLNSLTQRLWDCWSESRRVNK
jgi:hypothetical protein